LLNPPSSEYYKKTLEQAEKALRAYPGGMQIGGGVTAENASGYIEKGASHVIVTSYVFKGGKIRWDAMEKLKREVGKEKYLNLFLDPSTTRRENSYISAVSYVPDYVLINDVIIEIIGISLSVL